MSGFLYNNVEGFHHHDDNAIEQVVEDFPEDAAEWTGHEAGEVESIPHNVETGVDRFEEEVDQRVSETVIDVAEAPMEIADWAAEEAEHAEQVGDNVESAYDRGRLEGRDGDSH